MLNRLFQIVYLLLEKPQMTAKELADLFEVSQRTIYRDIDKLTLAGIPIYTNQGKNGGVSILPDYVLNKAFLTTEEKSKILESLNALNEVSFTSNQDAISKLRAFFGQPQQDWIEIEFSSWGNHVEDELMFEKIKNAILEHYFLKIVYSGNREGLVKRKVKPLKLCFKDQAWYLYAYCCLREDYRFFKLKRISDLTVLDCKFEPEAVGKVLSKESEAYGNHLQNSLATLEIEPEMGFRAYEELENIEVTKDGMLRCVIEVTDIDWLVSYVLSYGSYIRVLNPPELKERVMVEIKKMNQLYFNLTSEEN